MKTDIICKTIRFKKRQNTLHLKENFNHFSYGSYIAGQESRTPAATKMAYHKCDSSSCDYAYLI
jgi:hypothetical protein